MSETFPSDVELSALVTAALAAKDRDEPVDFVDLCGDRPQVIEAVVESLALAERIPAMQARSVVRDGYTGRVLGERYELRERLGAGSMGVVYSAFDRELQRPVAVKFLRSMLLEGGEAEQRFLREAETLATLQHRAIVAVHDRGRTDEDDPYLVMDLLEGASLTELIEGFKESGEGPGRIELATIAMRLGSEAIDEKSYLRLVVRWTEEIAQGLEAAHAAGIYHRDVKPSNLFVRRDGHPVLLDFGIAADEGRATLTREGASLGTPAYMAPEALVAGNAPTPALDVYGLTATLYHLLTLRAPYTGNPSQIFTALAVKEPVRAEKLRPGLPRDLQAILDRGMARRPGDRYPSAGALARDLGAFLDHRPVEARPISVFTRLWRRMRASKALRGGLTVFALALLVTVTVGWQSHMRQTRLREFRSLWKSVPGNFTLGNPLYRVPEPFAVDVFLELLDAAVDVADDPIPANLVRAAFRLDLGDAAGAAKDMRRVARSVDSAYASALADAYGELPATAQGADALRTEGLPEPGGALDRYLAAFHARRANSRADVRELLDHPSLEDHAPSLLLRLAYLVGKPASSAPDVIARIETLTDGRSAATAHWMGTHLFYAHEYERALDVLQEGIDWCDDAHALQVYAGWSALRIGRLELAVEYFERAKAIRPGSTGAFELQARALIELGSYTEARDVVESAPYGADDRAQSQRALLLAELESEQALTHSRSDNLEASLASARAALELFATAAEFGVETNVPRRAIAEALAGGDSTPVFPSILRIVEEREALEGRWLDVLLDWMPEQLDGTETEALRSMLEALQD